LPLQVFDSVGYGCLPAETNVGVVHVCHAADSDVEGFAGKLEYINPQPFSGTGVLIYDVHHRLSRRFASVFTYSSFSHRRAK